MAYSTIPKGSLYMNTKLYTGNGSTNAITGVGFQPDWVWVKNRDIGTDAPTIYDAVRGVTKRLQTSSTGAESTKTNGLTAFNSDGYTAGSASAINANGSNIVSWNWKANGAGSSNTDGSVTATVSANQTSGFSVIKLTNPASGSYTVGHGLGVAPDMLIFKSLDGGAQSWFVLHKDLTTYTNTYLYLEENTAEYTYSMQTQVPTNSLLYLNSGGVGNGNSGLICYAFASKQGYSKFGSYVGNGNADGTFVYTGFSPAFVMFKMTSEAQNWGIYDNKRLGYNEVKNVLFPNLSNAENTDLAPIDLLSNGFKMRRDASASDQNNKNGGTYIYMAFAENPFVATSGTSAIPVTAR